MINLLVCDSTFIISIIVEMDYPEFMNALPKYDKDIVIPGLLFKDEITHLSTIAGVEKYIKEGKFTVKNRNTEAEVNEFREDNGGIDYGEADALLTCQKEMKANPEKSSEICCVTNDKKAQRVAKQLGIEFKTTEEMVALLKEKKLLTPEVAERILKNLEETKRKKLEEIKCKELEEKKRKELSKKD